MKRKLTIFIALAILLISGSAVSVSAGTLRVTTEETELFAVPEGGWSTCTVFVSYAENYSVIGNKNSFNSRTKYYSIRTAYATTKPQIIMGNICHYKKNGNLAKTFKKYEQCDSLWDGAKWEYANTKKNTTVKKYKKTTGKYGYLPFMLYCEGAISATRPFSIKMNLKTS